MCIVITPLDCGVNKVQVQTEEDVVRNLGQQQSFMISDGNLPLFVRQTAIHANLALDQRHKSQKVGGGLPFVSNFVERLRSIKRIKSKVTSCDVTDSGFGQSLNPNLTPGNSTTSSLTGSTEQNRPRSMTIARSDSTNFPYSSINDGPDSEYPDDFTLRS